MKQFLWLEQNSGLFGFGVGQFATNFATGCDALRQQTKNPQLTTTQPFSASFKVRFAFLLPRSLLPQLWFDSGKRRVWNFFVFPAVKHNEHGRTLDGVTPTMSKETSFHCKQSPDVCLDVLHYLPSIHFNKQKSTTFGKFKFPLQENEIWHMLNIGAHPIASAHNIKT